MTPKKTWLATEWYKIYITFSQFCSSQGENLDEFLFLKKVNVGVEKYTQSIKTTILICIVIVLQYIRSVLAESDFKYS